MGGSALNSDKMTIVFGKSHRGNDAAPLTTPPSLEATRLWLFVSLHRWLIRNYARNRERILAERKANYRARNPLPARRCCAVCGTEITEGRSDRMFCSGLCRSRARSPQQKASYWQAYYRRKGEQLRANNRRRKASNRRPKSSRPCRHCGLEFVPKRDRAIYCSRRCLFRARVHDRDKENSARRAKSASRRALLPSRACKQWVHTHTRTCSARALAVIQESHPKSKGNFDCSEVAA